MAARARCRSWSLGAVIAEAAVRQLEVAAALLLPLDRLEQRLEVALPEALRAMPLDQLEEHRRPVLHRRGEDLQQVAVLVPVGEDAQLTQLTQRHPGLADPVAQILVVRVRGAQKLHTGGLHLPYRLHDIHSGQSNMLYAGAAVEFEVFVDLRLALADCRLVQRELDLAAAVRDDLAHQGRILRG